MHRSFSSSLLLLCIISGGQRATAQAVYGSIWGNVTDNSGKAIAGAVVVAKSIGKQTTEKVIANSDGGYVVSHLLPDDYYDLRVNAKGFREGVSLSILVYANQNVNVDFNLHDNAPSSKGESAGEQSVLTRYRADISTTFGQQDLANLPIPDRVFSRLQAYVPGAEGTLVFGDPHENLQIGIPIQLNSLLISGTRYEQDGTEIPKNTQGSLVINPSLEGLSQMQVSTENLDSEFGEATSVVILQTKSGTNSWHGTAFEYYQSQLGAAGPADVMFPGASSPNSNQFGGSIGGPLIRNKLFVFGDYEGSRRSTRGSGSVAVPTARVRSTCLDTTMAYCDLSDYGVNIYHPGTSQVFMAMGNCLPTVNACIPSGQLSPQAVYLLKLFPVSNAEDGSYAASGDEYTRNDNVDTRLDYVAGPRFKIFGRYSFGDNRQDAPAILGSVLGGPGFSQGVENPIEFAGRGRVRTHTLSAGLDAELRHDFVVDARFGFGRYHSQVLPYGYGTSPAQAAGIPNVNLGDILTSLLPEFDVQGGPRFGYSFEANNCNCPLLSFEQQFQGVNNWTKLTGRHITKWGADIRYLEGMRLSNTIPNVAVNTQPVATKQYGTLSVLIPDFNQPKTRYSSIPPAGHFVFAAANTGLNGTSGGLGLATFLLGDVTAFQRSLNNAIPEERERQWSFYGQDMFRITPRLTLTYGLRWEIYFPQTVAGRGEGAWLDLKTGLLNVAGYGTTNLHGNVRNSYTNVGPLLGVAYSVGQQFVLRAGYRRSFDPGLGALIFGDNVTHNPPIMQFQQCGGTKTATQTLFTLAQGPYPPPVANCGAVQLPGVSPAGQILLQPGQGTSLLPYPAQPANLVPSRVRVPTVDAWNASYQQALSQNLGFTLAYVGNKGTHVFFDAGPTYDLNQPTIKGFVAGTPISPSRYPLCQFAWARQNSNCTNPQLTYSQQINYFGANSSSHYQSLQASLQQRFANNMSLLASYTWSRATDFSPVYFNQDPRLGYAAGDFDRTHKFSMTNVMVIPVGRGQRLLGSTRGITSLIVSGWSLSATTLWASGLPFSPTYNPKECVEDRDTGPCQPNLTGPVHITGSRNGWFTTTPQPGLPQCTSSQCSLTSPWQRPLVGTFGDAGRNSLRGPSLFQTDLSLAKGFALTERLALRFRWDVYNAFNKVNLGEPSSCVDCGAGSGRIEQTAIDAKQRQMQFAVRLEF